MADHCNPLSSFYLKGCNPAFPLPAALYAYNVVVVAAVFSRA
jgi:hypothetical protein